MYSLYANDDNISYGIQKFVLDTDSDITNLPVDIKPGSSALIINSSNIYVLNHEKKWIKIKSNEAAISFLEWGRF